LSGREGNTTEKYESDIFHNSQVLSLFRYFCFLFSQNSVINSDFLLNESGEIPRPLLQLTWTRKLTADAVGLHVERHLPPPQNSTSSTEWLETT